jgi:Tol biopolymer transport system component/DNA-binding winged helix-turn-helix (wHTH) protein
MSNKTFTLYKFDEFCLDTNERSLSYANTAVSLTPKAYQTLLVLLENRNKIVEKEFLLNEVWADTFVEETTLSQNILTLRKALGKHSKDKDFIVTFPRRGFRFVADVEEILNDEETFVVEKHTRTHVLAEQEIHSSLESNIRDNPASQTQQASKWTALSPRSFAFVSVLVGLFAAFNFSLWYFGRATSFTEPSGSSVQTLISDTDIRNSAISPNGKYLAIIEVKSEIQTLSMRQIENGNTIEIVPNLNGTILGLVISPDNEQIYYSIYENSDSTKTPIGTLYKAPIFGGASQKIISNFDSSPAVSFDNSKIAFVRRDTIEKETKLIVANLSGSDERIMAVRPFAEGFTSSGASWSPDGDHLSAAVEHLENGIKSFQIAVVNSKTGEQNLFKDQNWKWAGQTAWLSSGRGFIIPVYRESSPTLSDELWQISYPEGKMTYINYGIKGIAGISINRETDSIVAIRPDKLTCFLSASLNNFRKSNLISTRIGDSCLLPVGADWTNDGKIIYSTAEGGNADIWTIDESGGGRKQITSDQSAEISPQLTNDGRYLIFLSNRSGKLNVWRANADGTNQIQLTDIERMRETFISPDGKSVFYVADSPRDEAETLWKMSINGENPKQLTSKTTRSPRISPDGKLIVCYFPNQDNVMSIALLSAETGEVVRFVETPANDNIPFLDWSKDGENLYVVAKKGKPFYLWKLSLKTGKIEEMREWENDAIFRFVVSKNGERVFYEVGTEIRSVVQFKPK